MKSICAVVFLMMISLTLVVQAVEPGIARGASYEEVIRTLGEPTGIMNTPTQKILLFDEGSVTLQNGKVVEVDITEQSIARAEKVRAEKEYEEAQRAKGLVPHEGKWITLEELSRKNKRAKLLKNAELRKAYPEGQALTIPCYYNKTEPTQNLPPGLVPRKGKYSYRVYLPRGYHDSPSKRYPCVFVVTQGAKEYVLARAWEEGWISVVPTSPNHVRDLSGNVGSFLAAYDDVEKRFRVSSVYRFAIETNEGGVVTLYAALRELLGVVVHDASFWQIGKNEYFYGCFRKSPKLRICGIFSKKEIDFRWSDNDRLRIKEKAPRYKLEDFDESYYGGLRILPPLESIGNAIDWLKKDLQIP